MFELGRAQGAVNEPQTGFRGSCSGSTWAGVGGQNKDSATAGRSVSFPARQYAISTSTAAFAIGGGGTEVDGSGLGAGEGGFAWSGRAGRYEGRASCPRPCRSDA